MTIPNDVTLVEGAIHNPNEPRHFMRVVPAPGRQLATVAEHPEAAWSDIKMVAGDQLCDLIAFDPTHVPVTQAAGEQT